MVTFGVELALGLNQTKAGRALNSLTIPMKYSAIANWTMTVRWRRRDWSTKPPLRPCSIIATKVVVLLLVTGRALDELLQVFPHHALFHSIVAENGAVLYHPHQDSVTLLAEPFSPGAGGDLNESGGAAHQPGQSGSSNLANPTAKRFKNTLADLELDATVIFNKRAVMILPAGVNKSQRSAQGAGTPGIGSRAGSGGSVMPKNDEHLLATCGYGVAVANALPALKAKADWVTSGERGAGVQELIHRLLDQFP